MNEQQMAKVIGEVLARPDSEFPGPPVPRQPEQQPLSDTEREHARKLALSLTFPGQAEAARSGVTAEPAHTVGGYIIPGSTKGPDSGVLFIPKQ